MLRLQSSAENHTLNCASVSLTHCFINQSESSTECGGIDGASSSLFIALYFYIAVYSSSSECGGGGSGFIFWLTNFRLLDSCVEIVWEELISCFVAFSRMYRCTRYLIPCRYMLKQEILSQISYLVLWIFFLCLL